MLRLHQKIRPNNQRKQLINLPKKKSKRKKKRRKKKGSKQKRTRKPKLRLRLILKVKRNQHLNPQRSLIHRMNSQLARPVRYSRRRTLTRARKNTISSCNSKRKEKKRLIRSGTKDSTTGIKNNRKVEKLILRLKPQDLQTPSQKKVP